MLTQSGQRDIQVGEKVHSKLQPYRQVMVALRKNLKLAAKYFRSFEILERVGTTSYKLDLPETTRVHLVFHVSQLKKAIGQVQVQKQLPQLTEQGTFDIGPQRVLDHRSVLRDQRVINQVLIQWMRIFSSALFQLLKHLHEDMEWLKT